MSAFRVEQSRGGSQVFTIAATFRGFACSGQALTSSSNRRAVARSVIAKSASWGTSSFSHSSRRRSTSRSRRSWPSRAWLIEASGAPDVVLIDPEVGVHVVEVKGVTLDQVEVVEAGGVLPIRYKKPTARSSNVLKQARDAMFAIKDATARAFSGNLRLRFEAWVAFPRITRAQWHAKFGQMAFCCDESLDLAMHSWAKADKP